MNDKCVIKISLRVFRVTRHVFQFRINFCLFNSSFRIFGENIKKKKRM